MLLARRTALAWPSTLARSLDEGPEDDLKAHRKLERDRRLPGDNPSLVQDVLRENEQDLGSILEHYHPLPAQRTPDRTPSTDCYIISICYIIYIVISV